MYAHMTDYDRGVLAGTKQRPARDKIVGIIEGRGLEYVRRAMINKFGNREYTDGVLAGLGAVPLRSDIERDRDRHEDHDIDIDVDGWD